MALTFLSEEWAAAVQDALNTHEGFKGAIGTAALTLQFNVSGAPTGDVAYYLAARDGAVDLSMGTAPDPDVTVSQGYDTAVAISRGELNTQTAFMTGKLKVSGNLAKLMMHQAAISQWQAAVADIAVDY